jgi:hypothetical protein
MKSNKYFSTHTEISFIKSIVRIIGFIAVACGNIISGSIILIVAEIIGIIEELYESK